MLLGGDPDADRSCAAHHPLDGEPPLNAPSRNERRPASRAYAILQILGWFAYATVGAVMAQGFGQGSLRYTITTYIGGAAGLAGTHLLRAIAKRRGWFDLPMGPLLGRLAVAVVATGLAIELLMLFAGIYATHAFTWKSSTPGILFATTFNWIFTILLWTALYTGVRFFRRWRDSEIRRLQLEVLARDAQLDALNAQIHPHFLFNALNVLRSMIAEDPALARDLVTELSELMRYALQAGRRERVSLEEELAVVESYLKIESARFEDRLRWNIEAADGVRAATLPPMLLQTLVENAVKHGIAAEESGGEVRVTAVRGDDGVRLRVTNPGRLGGPGDTRIGLANSRERLRLLYGERASLSLEERDRLVIAEVRLPFEIAPATRPSRTPAPAAGARA